MGFSFIRLALGRGGPTRVMSLFFSRRADSPQPGMAERSSRAITSRRSERKTPCADSSTSSSGQP
jgi:hypothetical protein